MENWNETEKYSKKYNPSWIRTRVLWRLVKAFYRWATVATHTAVEMTGIYAVLYHVYCYSYAP